MTVARRIATGTALLILLLVTALAVHLSVVRRLAESNRALSEDQIAVVVQALETLRGIERVDESTRKLAATGDRGYATQLSERQDELVSGLRRLGAGDLTAGERDALTRLQAAWRDFAAVLPPAATVADAPGVDDRVRLVTPALGRVPALRDGAGSLVRAANVELERQGERGAEALAESERLALMLFASALVVGVAAVVLAIRAVQRPLRRLVEATERITEQNYETVEPSKVVEYSRLTHAFNRMAERLSELDQMKRNLLSHVSHELRTPLANVEESHLLMLDGLSGPLTDEQRHLLELNVASCRRLGRLISNLLDLSRLDAGAVEPALAEVDLREILRAAAAQVGTAFADAELELALDLPAEPLRVVVDAEQVAQILNNLLENAAKYSLRGGRVELAAARLAAPPADLPSRWLSAFEGDPECVMIEVIDEGLGVADEEREKIFERFYRSARGRGGPPGVGLGLAICRELVAAHHGALWVAANEPRGSRFRLLLPARRATEASPAMAGTTTEVGA